MKRESGQITFWSDKGYGFIRPNVGERDIFVHQNEFDVPADETVRIGDRVSYTVGTDARRGKEPRVCAKQVRILVDGDDQQAAPGMYAAQPDTESALAEGLRKLLRDPQRDGETNP
jgi:cold shock CspA family protein